MHHISMSHFQWLPLLDYGPANRLSNAPVVVPDLGSRPLTNIDHDLCVHFYRNNRTALTG